MYTNIYKICFFLYGQYSDRDCDCDCDCDDVENYKYLMALKLEQTKMGDRKRSDKASVGKDYYNILLFHCYTALHRQNGGIKKAQNIWLT